jgi:8-oxo-dGTP pyrophosphatase MutT (NUDIX family)
MPMSPYVRGLRAKIGNDLLEVPCVSIIVFDASDRVLLVRHVEGDVWTTPGGMVEPHETPANAAVREAWEETGLIVELTHIVGVFGGPLFTTAYANGDRIAWVSTAFGARPVGGRLIHDNVETLEARYVARAEIAGLRCNPHVPQVLDVAYRNDPAAYFQPATWRP